MVPSDADLQKNRPLRWWALLSIAGIAVLLSLWTWQKWDAAWIERSETFFPPEWSDEDLETLAWQYPIYRSNDSYQWVHLADALGEGNHLPLHHRFDEGLPEGRPNRWHSGLAYLLSGTGSLIASTQDWPVERGIHQAAHWLGAAIHLCALLTGAALIGYLAGQRAALMFAGLFFFNAAIALDFAFSRLDHEAVFQFFFLLYLIGLAGLLSPDRHKTFNWALLAGIAAGFCWWISATIMSALSILTTIGILLECSRQRNRADLGKGILTWGGSTAAMILIFCLVDGRTSLRPSIATIHPIFIFAQIGAALACFAPFLNSRIKQLYAFLAGILCGASPLAWLIAYRSDAHPWLNHTMRRLHDYIVEFQSPFSNGLWAQAESIQAAAIGLLALCATAYHIARTGWSPAFWRPRRIDHRLKAGLQPDQTGSARLFVLLTTGLILLALLQTRWLGLLATAATVVSCLQLKRQQRSPLCYWSLGLLLLLLGTWAHKWLMIDEDPGRIFVTDLMLQVGARDININLQRLAGDNTIHVAMPYAFAATSALFPQVHPIGTFYWENAQGIEASSDFFAGKAVATPIDYAVVQGGRQGAPFAKLVNWVAKGDVSPASIESSLAWRLSSQQTPEGWEEMTFYGTFPDRQFDLRIFRRDQTAAPSSEEY